MKSVYAVFLTLRHPAVLDWINGPTRHVRLNVASRNVKEAKSLACKCVEAFGAVVHDSTAELSLNQIPGAIQ